MMRAKEVTVMRWAVTSRHGCWWCCLFVYCWIFIDQSRELAARDRHPAAGRSVHWRRRSGIRLHGLRLNGDYVLRLQVNLVPAAGRRYHGNDPHPSISVLSPDVLFGCDLLPLAVCLLCFRISVIFRILYVFVCVVFESSFIAIIIIIITGRFNVA